MMAKWEKNTNDYTHIFIYKAHLPDHREWTPHQIFHLSSGLFVVFLSLAEVL